MAAVGNNSSEGLKFGAGLFLTISFITLCVLVYFIAQDGAKVATKKFTGLNTELSNPNLSSLRTQQYQAARC